MSTKDGQFSTKDGRSRGTNPATGEMNPLAHVPLGQSPSTPNPPVERTMDSSLQQPGRYEVFGGTSVEPGEKPTLGYDRRVANPDVYHQEDPAQPSRMLTPETAKIRVVKKGEK